MKGRMGSSVCADVTQEQVRPLHFLIGHKFRSVSCSFCCEKVDTKVPVFLVRVTFIFNLLHSRKKMRKVAFLVRLTAKHYIR